MSRLLRLYRPAALTPQNIRAMLLRAAHRGAQAGFQLANQPRLEAFQKVVAERRQAQRKAQDDVSPPRS